MNRRLYLFNPGHDLALANGDENFNAPVSARSFAADLATLPVWYALPESVVWVEAAEADWMRNLLQFFPQLSGISVQVNPDLSEIQSLHPWGWDVSVRKSLSNIGIADALHPDDLQLDTIRRLSHRRTAVQAMQFLREDNNLTALLPPPAEVLSANQIDSFAEKFSSVVFKAPWSGSGKGIYWSSGTISESMHGWCRKISGKQGCIIGEEAYDKVQDFAMEFQCENGDVSFAGYSLFHTEQGVYKNNELMSDEAIFGRLMQRWIPAKVLQAVCGQLMVFIKREIASVYTGFLGVDMFVYLRDGQFRIHPCVEINLRMTMGMVARIFYDRFVHPDKTGVFYIDHFTSAKDLNADHMQRLAHSALEVYDGRITKGYLSLNPITNKSHYRARIEIR